MHCQLRIDLLSPTVLLAPPLPRPPDGVRMSGLRSDPGQMALADTLHAVMDITKEVPVPLLADWLLKRLEQHRALRFRINNREFATQAELERILSEELKNNAAKTGEA
jgi:hypothetical protein